MGESGTSLMVQWLRPHTPGRGGPGLIPGQGTRSHMPQLRVHMLQLNILPGAMKIQEPTGKTWHSQINKYFLKDERITHANHTCRTKKCFQMGYLQLKLKISLTLLMDVFPLVCVLLPSCSNFLQPFGLWPSRLLCPLDFSGKNTGVGCHFFLQGIFLTQELNLHFLCFRQILYC